MKKLRVILLGAILTSISSVSFGSLIDCYKLSLNIRNNSANVIKACLPYKNNNPKVQGILGSAYYFDKNYKLAEKHINEMIKYYQVSGLPSDQNARTGLADSYTGLGNLYYFGEGLPKNTQKGFEFISKGADLGSVIAQYQLGRIYTTNSKIPLGYKWFEISWINGGGDEANYKEDFIKLKKQLPYCTTQGQILVSNAYKNGIGGLEKSYDESMNWLNKAYEIDAKVPMVTFNLAQNYYTYEANKNKAFSYAKESVQAPYAPALELLGQYYLEGIGTKKNDVNAYVYLTLASYYYQNPAKSYWEKYVEPCRPDYTKNPQGFNLVSTNKSLEKIKLSNSKKQQAEIMIEKLKGELMKAGV